jgi:hypothetical protein
MRASKELKSRGKSRIFVKGRRHYGDKVTEGSFVELDS